MTEAVKSYSDIRAILALIVRLARSAESEMNFDSKEHFDKIQPFYKSDIGVSRESEIIELIVKDYFRLALNKELVLSGNEESV